MFITTKNKRSQLMFRRAPGDGQPPDIVLERPLTLVTEATVVLTDGLTVDIDSGSSCVVGGDLRVSVNTEVVLSLVCAKEV